MKVYLKKATNLTPKRNSNTSKSQEGCFKFIGLILLKINIFKFYYTLLSSYCWLIFKCLISYTRNKNVNNADVTSATGIE